MDVRFGDLKRRGSYQHEVWRSLSRTHSSLRSVREVSKSKNLGGLMDVTWTWAIVPDKGKFQAAFQLSKFKVRLIRTPNIIRCPAPFR